MTNKSLEALDELCDLATQDSTCLNYVIGLAMNIKQDLDRLNKFEKTIDILKDNLYIGFNDNYNGVSFKLDKYDECDYTILCLKDKQQYNLLKEILKR